MTSIPESDDEDQMPSSNFPDVTLSVVSCDCPHFDIGQQSFKGLPILLARLIKSGWTDSRCVRTTLFSTKPCVEEAGGEGTHTLEGDTTDHHHPQPFPRPKMRVNEKSLSCPLVIQNLFKKLEELDLQCSCRAGRASSKHGNIGLLSHRGNKRAFQKHFTVFSGGVGSGKPSGYLSHLLSVYEDHI